MIRSRITSHCCVKHKDFALCIVFNAQTATANSYIFGYGIIAKSNFLVDSKLNSTSAACYPIIRDSTISNNHLIEIVNTNNPTPRLISSNITAIYGESTTIIIDTA